MEHINGQKQIGDILDDLANHHILNMHELLIILIHLDIIYVVVFREIVFHFENENLFEGLELLSHTLEISFSLFFFGIANTTYTKVCLGIAVTIILS